MLFLVSPADCAEKSADSALGAELWLSYGRAIMRLQYRDMVVKIGQYTDNGFTGIANGRSDAWRLVDLMGVVKWVTLWWKN